ncbi:hypothetical protein H6G76_30025 [Nostoc sp. FACHB-152]|uniref:hypothetical protein n=1 Tax=unclassified Nostoc TaxID=2593658 RepID=UPI001687A7D8|nr:MULTISPECIES: hypothetical protein [unclassified Nostoc]MBD2451290.1 hypothetical protein [Nostoc sp. FACHB-152]MBD2466935.1 hypothetical protein [Nostoc sp. FACHB-145]
MNYLLIIVQKGVGGRVWGVGKVLVGVQAPTNTVALKGRAYIPRVVGAVCLFPHTLHPTPHTRPNGAW